MFRLILPRYKAPSPFHKCIVIFVFRDTASYLGGENPTHYNESHVVRSEKSFQPDCAAPECMHSHASSVSSHQERTSSSLVAIDRADDARRNIQVRCPLEKAAVKQGKTAEVEILCQSVIRLLIDRPACDTPPSSPQPSSQSPQYPSPSLSSPTRSRPSKR